MKVVVAKMAHRKKGPGIRTSDKTPSSKDPSAGDLTSAKGTGPEERTGWSFGYMHFLLCLRCPPRARCLRTTRRSNCRDSLS